MQLFFKIPDKTDKIDKIRPKFQQGQHATGPKGPHRPRWMHLVWRSATTRCSAKISMLFSDRCVLVPLLDLKCYLDVSETADRNRQF